MIFTDLKTEFAARGFDYLSATRQGYYVNAGRQRLDNMHLWPYREKIATGVAPLAVSDLGVIASVHNASQSYYELEPTSYGRITEEFGDPTTTGSPEQFYVVTTSGTPTVSTVPTNGDTLSVRYFKRTVDLSAGGDTPLAPSDYHLLIIDLAVQRAYLDNDELREAQALESWIQTQVAEMTTQLLAGQQIAGGADRSIPAGSVDG